MTRSSSEAIASRSTAASSSDRSSPRLNGDSRAACRMSSTHVRPIPAITCWSRSSECSGRGEASSSPRFSGGAGHASGPRVCRMLSASSASGRSSFTHAACLVPNSRSRSSRSSLIRSSTRDVRSRIEARLAYSCIRPALIRWVSSVSGSPPGVAMSRKSSFPRRRTPVNVPPSMACSGGSNVLSTFSPGVIADSIRSPGSASPSRRAVISISGSSGTPSRLVGSERMDRWVREGAEEIARRAVRHLEALVAVSSPSGDVHGAEECAAVCAALLPDEAEVERIPCSSAGYAPDLLARVRGTGSRRILLLGHLDTVVSHEDHKPLTRAGEKLVGSGSVDMKGGVVLSLGAIRQLVKRQQDYAEVALLVVCDEEWRKGALQHVGRFAGWDACLCFEGGERTADGDDAVVVRRKAAGTIQVTGHGRAAHSGSAPDRGRNALLALGEAARAVAGCHDPAGAAHLTAVPTVLRSGEAFNVVPGHGELFCDLRADDLDAIEAVLGAIPAEHEGVRLQSELIRRWPGMHSEAAVAPLLERASKALGRSVVPASRGGASDASHVASAVPVTVDGLGPRGGAAHNPDEFVLESSLLSRAEVALAVIDAALSRE